MRSSRAAGLILAKALEAWTAPCRRVVRGGSWNNNPQNLRTANRKRNTADNRNNNLGFRVGEHAFRQSQRDQDLC